MCLIHPRICPAYAGDICAQKVTGSSVFYLSRCHKIKVRSHPPVACLSLKRDITKEAGCKVDIEYRAFVLRGHVLDRTGRIYRFMSL